MKTQDGEKAWDGRQDRHENRHTNQGGNNAGLDPMGDRGDPPAEFRRITAIGFFGVLTGSQWFPWGGGRILDPHSTMTVRLVFGSCVIAFLILIVLMVLLVGQFRGSPLDGKVYDAHAKARDYRNLRKGGKQKKHL